jgi:hypothetical protein
MSPPAVPETVVGPVLVTVEPANTPYVVVLPCLMTGTAADVVEGIRTSTIAVAAIKPTTPAIDRF